ncbi:MAG: triose-phosphate isomerase [Rhodobacteraceae bacterium]|nr:triose-phosphate isomerase [Paracoccaceae bacterium]
MPRKLVAGNWKMHGLSGDLAEASVLPAPPDVDILLCPPATLITRMVQAVEGIMVGAQDCHPSAKGAHTGDLSAAMLHDAGASYVILGHSERRTDHGETDALVRAKTEAAWSENLIAIVCIGETEAQYKTGGTLDVLRGQLARSLPDSAPAERLVIAYEPVWAIGTGLVPTAAEIAAAHQEIRTWLANSFGTETAEGIRLLYGGSVKPSNAAGIFAVPNVDGALVGGASLTAADFGPIIKALAVA